MVWHNIALRHDIGIMVLVVCGGSSSWSLSVYGWWWLILWHHLWNMEYSARNYIWYIFESLYRQLQQVQWFTIFYCSFLFPCIRMCDIKYTSTFLEQYRTQGWCLWGNVLAYIWATVCQCVQNWQWFRDTLTRESENEEWCEACSTLCFEYVSCLFWMSCVIVWVNYLFLHTNVITGRGQGQHGCILEWNGRVSNVCEVWLLHDKDWWLSAPRLCQNIPGYSTGLFNPTINHNTSPHFLSKPFLTPTVHMLSG